MVKIGDHIPSTTLQGSPGKHHNLSELFAGKKSILFAVPGAFTPGCSRTHLPGYLNQYDTLTAQGYDLIVCVSVNDAYVMTAWGRDQGVEGKILMLADPDASFTQTLGLEVQSGSLGGIRSKRYSMVIDDGVITQLNVEPDSFGISCSAAHQLVDHAQ